MKERFHKDWLLIQQAQHYGIPTRFMDWTGDWKVGLFFAVSNPQNDSFDARLWIYLVPAEIWYSDYYEKQYLEEDPFEFSKTIILNSCSFISENYLSQIAQRRKARQKGRFLIQPYEKLLQPLEEQSTHETNLCSIIIKLIFNLFIEISIY